MRASLSAWLQLYIILGDAKCAQTDSECAATFIIKVHHASGRVWANIFSSSGNAFRRAMVRNASRIMRLVAILFLGRITRRSVLTEPTNQCPAQIFDLAS